MHSDQPAGDGPASPFAPRTLLIERIGDGLSQACNVFAAVGLIAITAINAANVIGRYFFGHAFSWAEELMQFIMIAAVFAGCVTITWRQLHIRIDLLLDLFGPASRRIVIAATGLIGVAAMLFIDNASFGIVSKLFRFDQRSIALELPLWIPQGFVAGGLLLMVVLIVLRIALSFRRTPNL